ncbi:hypothetical protein QML37_31290, partial [Klebsiella pneumoniae]|uniref:hypothetical protein n=1 Tax=Klebsiella pneumoniae TaxID=573 RepID=UPI003A7FA32B
MSITNCATSENPGNSVFPFIKLNSRNEWILDSGASDHLSKESNELHSYNRCNSSKPVLALNGHPIKVQGRGRIDFFNTHVNSNVLVLPYLSFNLLSIPKITKELNCLAIFSASHVIFQDRITQKTIGEGHLVDG